VFKSKSCRYDQLLSEPRFQCIEKIKTIGDTYMAAAGIKPESQVSRVDSRGCGKRKPLRAYLELILQCVKVLSSKSTLIPLHYLYQTYLVSHFAKTLSLFLSTFMDQILASFANN